MKREEKKPYWEKKKHFLSSARRFCHQMFFDNFGVLLYSNGETRFRVSVVIFFLLTFRKVRFTSFLKNVLEHIQESLMDLRLGVTKFEICFSSLL